MPWAVLKWVGAALSVVGGAISAVASIQCDKIQIAEAVAEALNGLKR